MRASDTDREQVMQLLQAAYAEGRITYSEHEERIAALRAKTFDELEELTADLIPVAPAAPPTVEPAMPTVVVSGTCVVGDISVRGPKQQLFWKRHVA